MKPSTDLVMQVLGDEDGFKIAEALIKSGPQTQSMLAANAEVSPQRTGEQLRLLRALGLVERERATRGKWSVTNSATIAAVFASAARLAAELDAARAHANAIDHAGWQEFTEEMAEQQTKHPPKAAGTAGAKPSGHAAS